MVLQLYLLLKKRRKVFVFLLSHVTTWEWYNYKFNKSVNFASWIELEGLVNTTHSSIGHGFINMIYHLSLSESSLIIESLNTFGNR